MNWGRRILNLGMPDDFAIRKTTEQTKMLMFRSRKGHRAWTLPVLIILSTLTSGASGLDEVKQDKTKTSPRGEKPVSYEKQIRPIIQAQCLGCHQPAKAGGRLRDDLLRFHAQGG